MYRRLIRGIVERGQTGALLGAARVAIEHQENRGISARTAIWAAMTGPTNAISIVMDFNTLEELERLNDLAAQDAQFAAIWADVERHLLPGHTNASIHRLSYHSEGLISAEEATAPRRFLRLMTGEVLPGKGREFVVSLSEALRYQAERRRHHQRLDRGVDATTSVWTALSGGTNAIAIAGEFDSMAELERFDDLALQDAEFARFRRATREAMAFLTTHVELMRNVL